MPKAETGKSYHVMHEQHQVVSAIGMNESE